LSIFSKISAKIFANTLAQFFGVFVYFCEQFYEYRKITERKERKVQFITYIAIAEKRAMIYVSSKIATADAWVGSGLVLTKGMTQI
jgi:hypothetical protein